MRGRFRNRKPRNGDALRRDEVEYGVPPKQSKRPPVERQIVNREPDAILVAELDPRGVKGIGEAPLQPRNGHLAAG